MLAAKWRGVLGLVQPSFDLKLDLRKNDAIGGAHGPSASNRLSSFKVPEIMCCSSFWPTQSNKLYESSGKMSFG